jgi:transcription antitermination factor NusG
MFIIKGNTRDIKFIQKHLDKNGYAVKPTECPQFIITPRDPTPSIPVQYINALTIKQIDENEDWRHVLKGFNGIKDLINAPPEFNYGAVVKIINGKFKDFTGRVVRNGESTCDVEISVLEKLRKETFNHCDLEVFESPFKT